jgi:uncharacterized protein (DUF488 family)
MDDQASRSTPLICTVGHSTHSLNEFVKLLKLNSVTHILDVRTVPRSRRNPQFNKDSLPVPLALEGIGYTHLPELGGLRRTHPQSVNTGWRNDSFRGYADYMQTDEFAESVDKVMALAVLERCALMCAEVLPWRCHRSLIADALMLRGAQVEDIIGLQARKTHRLTPWAHVDGLKIIYPPETNRSGMDEAE